jgi:hypothetical protein
MARMWMSGRASRRGMESLRLAVWLVQGVLEVLCQELDGYGVIEQGYRLLWTVFPPE